MRRLKPWGNKKKKKEDWICAQYVFFSVQNKLKYCNVTRQHPFPVTTKNLICKDKRHWLMFGRYIQ